MVHQIRLTILVLLVAGATSLSPSIARAQLRAEKPVRGYIDTIPPETPQERAVRHLRVAERRNGPCIMVHRGMSAAAPENTLETYAAAMDYGADGCEMDLRRTSDGVIVLFHDDMLDR